MGETGELEQQQHKEEKNGEIIEEMKPWEQHSSVISIPRFDYNAPSSLLQHSLSGFLITCPIKREKSATKEAISILAKYIETCGSTCVEGYDASENVKRRKLCPAEGEATESAEREVSKNESTSSEIADNAVKEALNLVLMKVTRSGLVLFTFPKGSTCDPVRIVSLVNQSLESGSLKRPLWCHRIFPIQATCRLSEKEVSTTVLTLVRKFVDDKANVLSKPLKFAVGYNRRGIEETEMKTTKGNPNDPNLCALLDRTKCFSVVAGAVKEAVSDATVDLKSPELCVLVELLPLSGMPNGALVTAISVLSRDLVDTKPKLCIKALGSESKTK
ncbi:hypothetical protein RND81_02G151500 [Saponaria officinalis]|uniref:THUMP domain-containing protein n=1 Tax=Saponaria officinalis TaxID=3572 RepID=A0AAW1MM94_SAPOF